MTSEYSTCPHLARILKDHSSRDIILKKYAAVVSWNVSRRRSGSYSAKRRKLSFPACVICELTLLRPFACLHCSSAGCWNDDHIINHLRASNHGFCTDVKSGSIFCLECDNFIYDPDIDALYLSTIVMTEEKQSKFQVAQKGRGLYQSWTATQKEAQALEGAVLIPCQGRRGLLNLGQTCFLNVTDIIRGLVRRTTIAHVVKWINFSQNQIYSEECTAFGPITFLATTWRVSTELAGYAQQDAHECFISLLNQIHSTSRGSTNVSCNCIIHSIFAGHLQSDVICEKCKSIKSTVDPMLDISLELRGKSGESMSKDNTLAACLRRFTRPEKLDPKEYTCEECGKASHEASKRLSIKKLPPVLSFQFKRFEHKATDKTSTRKIDTPIRFPASINMAPYTTLFRHETEHENSAPQYPVPEMMYEYDLFAVINHEGKLNNGHYTNFARFQDEWYRFDDDKVTPSSLSACLKSAAYMCFYVKRHLEYKPYMTPSYVLSHETAVSREKEMEKEKQAVRMKEVEDALLATV